MQRKLLLAYLSLLPCILPHTLPHLSSDEQGRKQSKDYERYRSQILGSARLGAPDSKLGESPRGHLTRISEPGNSLKNVEVFFGADRMGEVKTALDSMVVYDQWQQTGDDALLDQIAAYNETDCRSLLMCRDWLLRLRPPEVLWFGTGTAADASVLADDPARAAKRREDEERSAALVARLMEGVTEADREWREFAGHLVDFHKREAKPDWWAMFNRQDMA